jgi:hypothetical protein
MKYAWPWFAFCCYWQGAYSKGALTMLISLRDDEHAAILAAVDAEQAPGPRMAEGELYQSECARIKRDEAAVDVERARIAKVKPCQRS